MNQPSQPQGDWLDRLLFKDSIWPLYPEDDNYPEIKAAILAHERAAVEEAVVKALENY